MRSYVIRREPRVSLHAGVLISAGHTIRSPAPSSAFRLSSLLVLVPELRVSTLSV